MSGPRYHPDEGRHDARENWRSGRSSLQAKHALSMRAARQYVIAHPGCTWSEIAEATKVRRAQMNRLLSIGAIYCKQPLQPDGRRPQLYYPKPLTDLSAPETER